MTTNQLLPISRDFTALAPLKRQEACTRLPIKPAVLHCGAFKLRAAAPDTPTLSQLPEPSGDWKRKIPVIGETFFFTSDAASWARDRVACHGPVFQSHLLGKPTVVVGDLPNWQKALAADFKHLHQKFPESFMKASGSMPMNIKEVHASRRKTIAKAFESEAMAGYLPFMEAILTKYLAIWADKPAGVDLRRAGQTLGFEFAAALVLGQELDEQTRDELSQHYANVIKAFFTIP
ncbi:hypothetical protein WJX84_012308, partial [Apatococcus fuscideae]